MNRLSLTTLLLLLPVLAWAGPGDEDPADLFEQIGSQPEGTPVRARLIAESDAITPGGSVWLGVHLDQDPGWHTYWKNSGDAGLSTEVDWELPEGFTVSALVWPAPHRYVEAGGTFIDTADVYTGGTSERLLGKFMGAERDRFVIATKFTAAPGAPDPNAVGNGRKHILRAVEASLQRLGTDYIDVYWLHAWDYLTPIEEVMQAFDDLVRSGKVLYVGLSDTPSWVVARGQTLAELRGATPLAGIQIQYSLSERGVEADFFSLAESLDLGICCWSPLDQGLLSGKFGTGVGASSGSGVGASAFGALALV